MTFRVDAGVHVDAVQSALLGRGVRLPVAHDLRLDHGLSWRSHLYLHLYILGREAAPRPAPPRHRVRGQGERRAGRTGRQRATCALRSGAGRGHPCPLASSIASAAIPRSSVGAAVLIAIRRVAPKAHALEERPEGRDAPSDDAQAWFQNGPDGHITMVTYQLTGPDLYQRQMPPELTLSHTGNLEIFPGL